MVINITAFKQENMSITEILRINHLGLLMEHLPEEYDEWTDEYIS